ncbi:2'-5' RNA ligase family protein [Sphingomonas sp. MG17]|uniref:2'-5' RNA ligase family protein n=1 Tax=Sphingomonas tagetis TaxID=2949092 RepID=A0A9X2KR27_9SPHN|nr:2'-5' RNA ligase family protein [Sphingomonas tagetis]MCP3732358.1 2'-5' RNA ligase family protein [Sphingomonas tagetis]
MRPRPKYLLLIKPPLPVADHIDGLRGLHGIDRSYTSDKLHGTLLPLGDIDPGRVRDHLSDFRAAPFRVVFDRIEHAVLNASETIHGLIAFHRRLVTHLRHAGCRLPDYTLRPHVTLSYKARLSASFGIDPVSWRVEEFLLIESHAGRHRQRGRWRLD